jgi:hypothetical protein
VRLAERSLDLPYRLHTRARAVRHAGCQVRTSHAQEQQRHGRGLAQLVRAEYLEIPGLNLTRDEAQRLWGLDREACEQLLAALVERRFLKRTRDNRYLRVDGSV